MSFQQNLIGLLNPIFTTSDWIDRLETENESAILAATERSGKVVLEQFHGFNDLSGKDVLDFGCGSCGKSLYYARQGAKSVRGTDVRLDHTAVALDAAAQAGLDVKVSPITASNAIPFGDSSFDVVISSSVLEHLPDLDFAMQEVFRVLRPGGLFLNRWHPFGTRYGSHLHHVIGIPFAHRIFSEGALIRYYYDRVMGRYGRVPEALGNLRRDGTLDDIMPMNRISLQRARKSFSRAGLREKERRYYKGTEEQGWLSSAPDAVRILFSDYEVNILEKPA